MLGDNIKNFRLKKGYSQKYVAEKVGVTEAYISLIERNKRTNLGSELLEKLSEVLGVNITEFYNEDENTVPSESNFDLGSAKLNKIARYAKDLTETDQDTVLNVVEALRRAKSKNDRNDDTDEL